MRGRPKSPDDAEDAVQEVLLCYGTKDLNWNSTVTLKHSP